jgi:uncharacterized repeat protein (TIGR04138 family)
MTLSPMALKPGQMQQINFEGALDSIVDQNPAYHREGYIFLKDALDFTQKKLAKISRTETGHVSGKELLDGIREYALTTYGPMALTVLEEWGVHSCQDFGRMVFLMVENNLLKKTEKDTFDDFLKGYSFEEAFRNPFLPEARKKMPEQEPNPVNSEA